MYRTPFASLRVPSIDDTDPPQGLINLATDIQFKADVNAARLAEVRRRRGVALSSNAATALASGSLVAVPFDFEEWDTDNHFTVGSPTIVTLPRGLWLVYASALFIGSGSLSWSLMDVTGSVSGAIFARQNGTFAASVTSTSELSGSGMFYTTGENLTMHLLQSSAGAGSIVQAKFRAMRIGSV